MRVNLKFGEMHYSWQDRKAKPVLGFEVVLADGYRFRHNEGLITIPQALILEHGRVTKVEAVYDA
jgi:hypothetical protein